MNSIRPHSLIVIVGATGVGKTELALNVATQAQSSIISADSRQMYQHMIIGTASPTPEERSRVKHYFVEKLAIESYYNARTFEDETLHLLDELFLENPIQVLTGGSMLYIDAVTKGIDDIPDVDPAIRARLFQIFEQGGLDELRLQLKLLDPVFYNSTDIKNPKRILHGLEICLTTGSPYSSFRNNSNKKRPFAMVSIGLERSREELYERINARVISMVKQGLVEECEKLLPFRHCNALNTVGYKEMFGYLDGEYTLDRAIELIQRNTRHYAKKQITWFKKDPNTHWFHPDEWESIQSYLNI